MWGELTDSETKTKVEEAFKKNHAENLEVLIYKKNSKFFWSIFSIREYFLDNFFFSEKKKLLYGYLCK